MKLFARDPNKKRLQVFLSHSGVCSRRKAMDLIKEGRVSVNGKVVKEPSTKILINKDQVSVDGKEIQVKKLVYFLFNKPSGYVTSKVEQRFQKTIYDLLSPEMRGLSPAGRLDQNTEGLLLLTNDGDMIYKLTHPKFNVNKTYVVKVQGCLNPKSIKRLKKGVIIENIKTAPARIKNVKTQDHSTTFEITIHEGRKRQIRLMLAKVGHKVIYLKRISQGPLKLGDLKLGKHRELDSKEISHLRKL